MKLTDGPITRTHYISDLLVLNFAHALIKISNEMDDDYRASVAQNGLISDNMKYDEGMREMLDSMLLELQDEIYKFMMQTKHRKIAHKTKDKLEKSISSIFVALHKEDVQLDVLSMYILYNNFTNREVIHKNFQEWIEPQQYQLIVDTLDSSGFSLMDKLKMNKMSKEILIRIK